MWDAGFLPAGGFRGNGSRIYRSTSRPRDEKTGEEAGLHGSHGVDGWGGTTPTYNSGAGNTIHNTTTVLSWYVNGEKNTKPINEITNATHHDILTWIGCEVRELCHVRADLTVTISIRDESRRNTHQTISIRNVKVDTRKSIIQDENIDRQILVYNLQSTFPHIHNIISTVSFVVHSQNDKIW